MEIYGFKDVRGKFQVQCCLIDFLDVFRDNFIEVIKKDNFIEVGMSSPTSKLNFDGSTPRNTSMFGVGEIVGDKLASFLEWAPLLVGKFKLNFDGSTPRNTSMFGVGEIVGDKLASFLEWAPLLVGKFKLNFDGSTPRNTSMFGAGEIVRDKLASLITCSDIP
eukprot:TRINITY_DN19794_c0_g1_i1.p2 TRINITY_DN19794_c0_g1~~TRINITY_DN19794_c0_g1_i1.p2  ORF type:complete len:163 (-),score=27.02 TRINITY_DN19794_c0_g1_i1:451-939(-)